VRLNIISTLHAVNTVVGVDLLSQSLLPAITELAEDRQWRVRLAIIDYFPLLAAQLGVQFFEDKLRSMCIGWLQDCVYTIRESAIVNVRKMVELFGVEWASKSFIPAVLQTSSSSNYLYRLTSLSLMTALAGVVSVDLVCGTMLPLVMRLGSDVVPNVRFNVAKTLQALIPLLGASVVQSQIKPRLIQLAEDNDSDVQYFANQALQSC